MISKINVYSCTSVFQLFTAISIHYGLYKDSKAIYILGDNIPKRNLIQKNIISLKETLEAICLNTMDYNSFLETKTKNYNTIKKFKEALNPQHIFEYCCIKTTFIDIFFYVDPFKFNEDLYRKFKYINPNLKLYNFEDGTGHYVIDSCYSRVMKKEKIWKEKLGVHYSKNDLDGIYLFAPQCLDWKPEYPVIQVPKINHDIIEKLNIVFNYKEKGYPQRVIFFSTTNSDDNKMHNDIVVLNEIANHIGKDNILVKKHPRDFSNIYDEYGFKTAPHSDPPWELIAANTPNINQTVLISYFSGTLIMPNLAIGTNPISLSLLGFNKIYCGNDSMTTEKWFYKHFEKTGIVKFPKNITEVKQIIEDIVIKDIN